MDMYLSKDHSRELSKEPNGKQGICLRENVHIFETNVCGADMQLFLAQH